MTYEKLKRDVLLIEHYEWSAFRFLNISSSRESNGIQPPAKSGRIKGSSLSHVRMFEQPLAVLTMRRHEKDFMLLHDRKYGDDLTLGFAAGLKSGYSGDGKDRAQAKACLLSARFLAWMETALTLAGDQKATRIRYQQSNRNRGGGIVVGQ